MRGTVRATARASSTPSGTTAQNSARQVRYSPARPPPTLPVRPPRPAASVHVASTWPRRSGGLRWTSTDMVAGMIRAAPAPHSPRPAMSTAGAPASALTAPPAANSPSPASRAPLRPYRSPSAPAGISSAAKTMTYASTDHTSWPGLGCRADAASCGISRLTAATMACATSTQAHSTSSTGRVRAARAGAAGPAAGPADGGAGGDADGDAAGPAAVPAAGPAAAVAASGLRAWRSTAPPRSR